MKFLHFNAAEFQVGAYPFFISHEIIPTLPPSLITYSSSYSSSHPPDFSPQCHYVTFWTVCCSITVLLFWDFAFFHWHYVLYTDTIYKHIYTQTETDKYWCRHTHTHTPTQPLGPTPNQTRLWCTRLDHSKHTGRKTLYYGCRAWKRTERSMTCLCAYVFLCVCSS